MFVDPSVSPGYFSCFEYIVSGSKQILMSVEMRKRSALFCLLSVPQHRNVIVNVGCVFHVANVHEFPPPSPLWMGEECLMWEIAEQYFCLMGSFWWDHAYTFMCAELHPMTASFRC